MKLQAALSVLLSLPLACGSTHTARPTPNAPAPTQGTHEPAPAAEAAHDRRPAQGGGHDRGHGRHDPERAGCRKDFSAVDQFAAHFDDPKRDGWQKPDEVVRLLEIAPGQVVADLGAGTGYFEARLSAAVGPEGRVLALDAEPKMVEHLNQRGAAEHWSNVEARAVPYDDPGLRAESVDRVLIVNTWHHISDRPAYARKLLTSLRPSGTVVVVDFTPESDVGPPAHHRLAADRVVSELEAGGFEAQILVESLPKQYAVRGSRPSTR